MKKHFKAISFILSILMASASISASADAAKENDEKIYFQNNYYYDTLSVIPKFKFGDVNTDFNVDMKDVVNLQKYIANLESDVLFLTADVNNDNEVNMLDTVAIQQIIANSLEIDLSVYAFNNYYYNTLTEKWYEKNITDVEADFHSENIQTFKFKGEEITVNLKEEKAYVDGELSENLSQFVRDTVSITNQFIQSRLSVYKNQNIKNILSKIVFCDDCKVIISSIDGTGGCAYGEFDGDKYINTVADLDC